MTEPKSNSKTAVCNTTSTAVALSGLLFPPGETLITVKALEKLKQDQGFLRRLRSGSLLCKAVKLPEPEKNVITAMAACDRLEDLKAFENDNRPTVRMALEGCRSVLTDPRRVPKILECKTPQTLLDIWQRGTGLHPAEIRACQAKAAQFDVTLPENKTSLVAGIVAL